MTQKTETLELPVLPLRQAVLFPGAIVPYEVARPKTLALAEALGLETARAGGPAAGTAMVATFAQRSPETADPGPGDLHPIGVAARVLGLTKQESGSYAVLVQGLHRIRLDSFSQTEPFVRARVTKIEVPEIIDEELSALGLSLRDATKELIAMLPNLPREISSQIESVESPGALADLVANYVESSLGEPAKGEAAKGGRAAVTLTVADKVNILALVDPKARVREVLRIVTQRMEVFRVKKRIDEQVRDEIGKTQREHVLRQQLKAIQEELRGGEDDDGSGEIEEIEKRIAETALGDEAREVARKQVKRLRAMQPTSPEYSMIRTYLDWILELPWGTQTDDRVEIAGVRAQLEADHYGLEKVKKRILEYLAVRKLKNDKKGPILCLVGPPGVGKTSLGRSIATAMGRKLQRISLGGVHDEAAIRGHRRTYIGALPGKIIQAMKKAGTINPILLLDEVDKLGRDQRGDPASALLEVLDPEQNNTFADHYLEIPYDLSNVMFITTANVMDTIPGPLRDRMEIIEIPGYTRREKLAIARRHLWPKQLLEHGVTEAQLELTDEALESVIDSYTREAGVRGLEQKIAAVVRGIAVKLAEEGPDKLGKRVVRGEADLREFLGPVRFTNEVAERTEDPGVATGLAWTPVGGEILFIEATRMHGSGKVQLTGQLGDVMKESATAALSFVRANAEQFAIPRDFLEKIDVHIHVPSGAMPKDGPSAGVTMLAALVSLLTGVRVRHDVAMTGEITLRGRVLPIGGVKEKLIAAHRAGIKRIILPARNSHDLEEVPEDVRKDLDIRLVEDMSDVVELALEKPEAGPGRPAVPPAVPIPSPAL